MSETGPTGQSCAAMMRSLKGWLRAKAWDAGSGASERGSPPPPPPPARPQTWGGWFGLVGAAPFPKWGTRCISGTMLRICVWGHFGGAQPRGPNTGGAAWETGLEPPPARSCNGSRTSCLLDQ